MIKYILKHENKVAYIGKQTLMKANLFKITFEQDKDASEYEDNFLTEDLFKIMKEFLEASKINRDTMISNLDNNTLFKMLTVGNYIDYEPLLYTVGVNIAARCKGKSAIEMNKIFKLEGEPHTKETMKRAIQQNDWKLKKKPWFRFFK